MIKIVLGNSENKPSDLNWYKVLKTIENLFENYCCFEDIEVSDIKTPSIGSIFRNPLFVGQTGAGAERSNKSQASSCTYESMRGVLDGSLSLSQTESSTFIGESVSQTGANKNQHSLQRAQGILTIGNLSLDKSNPKGWSKEQVETVLLDNDVGVGLEEEQLQGFKIYASDLENVVDSLLSFRGDMEGKIEHACNILFTCSDFSVRQSIVSWVFTKLLE